MVSRQLINDLRKKQSPGPWVHLVDFFNEDNLIFLRLTDYRINLNYQENIYSDFPFLVAIPSFQIGLGQSIRMVFANFPYKNYNSIKEDILKVRKVRFRFANVNFLNENFFEDPVYYLSNGNSIEISSESIVLNVSKKVIEDAPFPFRIYNSDDHPLLYEDFTGTEEVL